MSHFNDRFPDSILSLNPERFEEIALQIYHYQFHGNRVYSQFSKFLGKTPQNVSRLTEIPFLPIELYKEHIIITGSWKEEMIFESSRTTGAVASKLYVKSLNDYLSIAENGFTLRYGSLSDFLVLALLPSYLEKGNSSLVAMAQHFIQKSGYSESGFFLYEHAQLYETLNRNRGKKVLLLGVTYALLDFCEKYSIDGWPELIIMETGGMKGRRQEMTREEVHRQLINSLGVQLVHSEYGMTEMTSQAYSKGNGIFECPPWVKVQIREINDPLSFEKPGRVGVINWIDLANLHTCSFIATSDLGRQYPDGRFEVLGRVDNSDTRGCNLMVSQIT